MARKRRTDRNHCLYQIRCIATGERYIGLTVAVGRAFLKSVRKRWLTHVYQATVERRGHRLQRTIRKYGAEAFTHELLAVVRGKRAAHDLEMQMIRRRRPQLNVEGTGRKSVRK
jgi:hypothetical protein